MIRFFLALGLIQTVAFAEDVVLPSSATQLTSCQKAFENSERFLECSQDMIQEIKNLDNQTENTHFMEAAASQSLQRPPHSNGSEPADQAFALFTLDIAQMALDLSKIQGSDVSAYREEYFSLLSRMRDSFRGLYQAKNGPYNTLSRKFYKFIGYFQGSAFAPRELTAEEDRYYKELSQHMLAYARLKGEFQSYAKSR